MRAVTYNGLTTKALSEKLSNPLSERRLRDQLSLLNKLGIVKPEGSTSNSFGYLLKDKLRTNFGWASDKIDLSKSYCFYSKERIIRSLELMVT